ncbi:MAG: hypothetical protein AVDCRST_MAG73-145, partial [uncultured Thermomicrobiales bacterium]
EGHDAIPAPVARTRGHRPARRRRHRRRRRPRCHPRRRRHPGRPARRSPRAPARPVRLLSVGGRAARRRPAGRPGGPAGQGRRRPRGPRERGRPARRQRARVRRRAGRADPDRRRRRPTPARAVPGPNKLPGRERRDVRLPRAGSARAGVPPRLRHQRALLHQLDQPAAKRGPGHGAVQGVGRRPEQGRSRKRHHRQFARGAVPEPPRGRHRVRAGRLPLHRSRRRRSRGRPAGRRPRPDDAPRQDAAHRRRPGGGGRAGASGTRLRRRRQGLRDPAGQPVCAGRHPDQPLRSFRRRGRGCLRRVASGRPARNLGLRVAQPVAVQLRPPNRGPLDRRRRPELLGGDRLRAGRQRRGVELRLEVPPGRPLLPELAGTGLPQGRRPAGRRVSPHPGAQPVLRLHRDRDGRLPRPGIAGPGRHPLQLGLLLRPDLGGRPRRRRQLADAGAARHGAVRHRRRRERERRDVPHQLLLRLRGADGRGLPRRRPVEARRGRPGARGRRDGPPGRRATWPGHPARRRGRRHRVAGRGGRDGDPDRRPRPRGDGSVRDGLADGRPARTPGCPNRRAGRGDRHRQRRPDGPQFRPARARDLRRSPGRRHRASRDPGRRAAGHVRLPLQPARARPRRHGRHDHDPGGRL